MLDVGCGNGTYLAAAQAFAVGVDIERDPAWLPGECSFAVSDAVQLPFSADSFDTVVSFETLEHLRDPVEAMREYRRIARTTGIFTVPNCTITEGQLASNLIYRHWVDDTHLNFFTPSTFCDALNCAGWSVREVGTINRIDLSSLVLEALRLPRRLRRPLGGYLRRFGRPYEMTILAIATPRPDSM